MLRYASILLGAAAGALYLRERRARIALERLGAASLETILDAIDANNPDTGAHVRRVAEYALILADAADCTERQQRSVERVALFHDIGKIDGALTDIVNESTKLTPKEREAITHHPRRGAEVLQPLESFYPDLPSGVLSHHERWDGTGYPRQLAGKLIPLTARIVAIADTFDAITHSRSYRGAQSVNQAIAVLSEGRGTQFDPDLTDLFLSEPVMECVLHSMRKLQGPRRKSAKRRTALPRVETPDLTFRWRTKSLVQQNAGR
jgi:HD-GYP domain-containing protein (c-di-GMP phosphodiesterase class II)